MTGYTVHVHPNAADDAGDDGAIFIPEAFCWSAYAYGPFWLIAQRAWLGVLVWAAAIACLALATARLGLPPAAVAGLVMIGEIYLGLEGHRLRGAALGRRGYRLVDVVSASRVEDAERAYFRRAVKLAGVAAPRSPTPLARSAGVYQVGVLFPQQTNADFEMIGFPPEVVIVAEGNAGCQRVLNANIPGVREPGLGWRIDHPDANPTCNKNVNDVCGVIIRSVVDN